ncbi:hypothetical protein ACFSQ3_15655 [Sphingobacterium corticis]|uniref:Adhesin domain-containing protein n=1 Tax=Sphingobacterium corticis TaxID=1812823 RepID=A0ABW5NPN0_9SPHI
MKTTTQIICAIALALTTNFLWAQNNIEAVKVTRNQENSSKKNLKEFRFKKNSGKLEVNVNTITVEGYDGNEVIIKTHIEQEKEDARAAGLQSVNSSGLQDNTGIGFNLTESDGKSILRVINAQKLERLHIQLPKNVGLIVNGTQSSWMSDNNMFLTNLSGEIEISNIIGDIKLDNVNGPMAVKTVHGNIEAIMKNRVKGPVSLVTVQGFVDLAIPTSIAANVDLRTTYGDILAADELKMNIQTPKKATSAFTAVATYVDTDEIEKSVEDALSSSSTSRGDSLRVEVRAKAIAKAKEIKEKTNKVTNELINSTINKEISVFAVDGVGNRIQSTINGGGENISLRTTHGKIYLRTTDK